MKVESIAVYMEIPLIRPNYLKASVWCYFSGTVLQDVLKSSRIGRLMCPLLVCRGMTGQQLHMCYEQHCSSDTSGLEADESVADCIRDHCSSPFSSQYLRDACVFWKCGAMDTAMDKRGDIMWPDEFETRSVYFWPDEMETRSSPLLADGLDDDIGRAKREMEQGRPVNSQGCSNKCHGFTGVKYTACIALACPHKSNVVTVKKRWSTRLCMEAHCKGLADKVEYFLCGKQKCHK